MKKRIITLFILISMAFSLAPPANAITVDLADYPAFDPNYILSDNDIFDSTAMPYDRMVNFLRSKGTLANLKVVDTDGKLKIASEIIWRISQSYKMNPKYLLALLQKEQSLVEDPAPTQNQLDWATGYGICDSCSKDDPDLQELRGFGAQLEWAAKQHREKYLMQLLTNGLTIGGQGMGKTAIIDGVRVTPVNHATAMLYSYTPHIHGNINLWKIWKRWFSVSFPDGTVVHSDTTDQTYLIRFGEKRPFASAAVVSSLVFDEKKIITVSDAELQNYADGPSMKFPKYSLLKDPNGKIYLLTEDSKRHIATMEAFRKFGFNMDEVEDVELEDLAAYPDGDKITIYTSFPQGVLMKTADSPGVWYVEDGWRQPLIHPVFISLYFHNRRIKIVSATELESYPIGQLYHLHNGELVKAEDDSTVYVVEHSLLRAIPSEQIFEEIGWQWKNIVEVPVKILAIHKIGEPFIPQTNQEPEPDAILTLN
ncbi:hypothetical protein KJ937_00400 [Patescibacteria group bacterium]|nr:hypothetical protein [Patescibacteria group bacterium]